mmetsp:Transcript_21768/g.49298  ORF Transcript_21768/g.49298 Transcript_21768/m.49298 type:complete len:300 (-) Transcript_21768:801-1700(-)
MVLRRAQEISRQLRADGHSRPRQVSGPGGPQPVCALRRGLPVPCRVTYGSDPTVPAVVNRVESILSPGVKPCVVLSTLKGNHVTRSGAASYGGKPLVASVPLTPSCNLPASGTSSSSSASSPQPRPGQTSSSSVFSWGCMRVTLMVMAWTCQSQLLLALLGNPCQVPRGELPVGERYRHATQAAQPYSSCSCLLHDEAADSRRYNATSRARCVSQADDGGGVVAGSGLGEHAGQGSVHHGRRHGEHGGNHENALPLGGLTVQQKRSGKDAGCRRDYGGLRETLFNRPDDESVGDQAEER